MDRSEAVQECFAHLLEGVADVFVMTPVQWNSLFGELDLRCARHTEYHRYGVLPPWPTPGRHPAVLLCPEVLVERAPEDPEAFDAYVEYWVQRVHTWILKWFELWNVGACAEPDERLVAELTASDLVFSGHTKFWEEEPEPA